MHGNGKNLSRQVNNSRVTGHQTNDAKAETKRTNLNNSCATKWILNITLNKTVPNAYKSLFSPFMVLLQSTARPPQWLSWPLTPTRWWCRSTAARRCSTTWTRSRASQRWRRRPKTVRPRRKQSAKLPSVQRKVWSWACVFVFFSSSTPQAASSSTAWSATRLSLSPSLRTRTAPSVSWTTRRVRLVFFSRPQTQSQVVLVFDETWMPFAWWVSRRQSGPLHGGSPGCCHVSHHGPQRHLPRLWQWVAHFSFFPS